jgi:hypothetical protein
MKAANGDNIAAMFFVSRDALGEAAALRPRHRHHIGQQHRERLIADDFAGAPDRVAEAERNLLTGEARRAGGWQIGRQGLQFLQFAAWFDAMTPNPLVPLGLFRPGVTIMW